MIKDITNQQNIQLNNQLNSNRTRLSIYNFQNEINSLLEQQEQLESENDLLKQRLVQKNEDLLLRLTNSLPKEYTDGFLLGLKKQSLHLDFIGDIAMSNTLNDQFEATCSKQVQTDIMNLRSIIHIQREKLKASEIKIFELNDFVREQDSLLTQTKELLKAKCAKIQLLEEKLQEQNAQQCMGIQQQEKQLQNQMLNFLKTEEEELEFAFQLDESRRSNKRAFGNLGDNSCSLSPSEIIEHKKDNSNYFYHINQMKKYENNNSQISPQRLSLEKCNSSRILQNNKNIMNKDNNLNCNQNKQDSVLNSSRSKIGYREIHKYQENIRKSQEKQYYEMENIIRNNKSNNSPTLSVQSNNRSYSNKQNLKDSFEQRGRQVENTQENQSERNKNPKVENENSKQYQPILSNSFLENQLNSQKNKQEDRCKQLTYDRFYKENSDKFQQQSSERGRQENQNRSVQQKSDRSQQDSSDQNKQESSDRSKQERSNSMKQLNQYIILKQKNQQISHYNNNQNNNIEKQCNREQQYQVNNSECFENSSVKNRQEYFQIPKQNNNNSQQVQSEEYVNKSNRSLYNNYNSSLTTDSDFNVSYFLNQKLQQKPPQIINNDIQKNQQLLKQQSQLNANSFNKMISNNYINKENNSKNIDDGIKINYSSNQTQNDQSHQSLFSNMNFSNVFDIVNGAINVSSNKPSNLSTLKTFNSINNQSQQQIQQPPLYPNQKNTIIKNFAENIQVNNQQLQFNVIEPQKISNNILSSLETDQNQNNNQKCQLLFEDDIQSKNGIKANNQQIFEENQITKCNQSLNKNQCDLPISIHHRNRSSSNYFNIYEQKAMNVNQINQDQQTRRLASLNARTEYSNQKQNEQQENKMRNSIAHNNNNNTQPFNTDITPHKRQNSQSNSRRRSRAERLQKSTSSIKIYTSNDYNTFNPLN